MKLIIEKGVKEYLKKHDAECIVIDMIKDETSGGCSCGITKKYYTPYIRVSKEKDNMSKKYAEYEADGVKVLIDNKASSQIGNADTVTVFIEKVFFSKKLNVEGIKTIIE